VSRHDRWHLNHGLVFCRVSDCAACVSEVIQYFNVLLLLRSMVVGGLIESAFFFARETLGENDFMTHYYSVSLLFSVVYLFGVKTVLVRVFIVQRVVLLLECLAFVA